MLKNARFLTRPTPSRRDAPFRGQGRSERRAEEAQTALRVGRLPFEWFLANGKTPPVLPTYGNFFWYVELLSDARTMLADFLSILLGLFDRFFDEHLVGLCIERRHGLIFGKITRDRKCFGVGRLGGLNRLQ
jgi:hypothetical protein